MKHNVFKEYKAVYIVAAVLSLPVCACAVYMKIWVLAVISAVCFVTVLVGLVLTAVKDKREKKGGFKTQRRIQTDQTSRR